MTITFSAARNREHSAIAKALSPTVRLSHANDNTRDICGDSVMRAALELFAAHGIGATQEAFRRARHAASVQHKRDCGHWLAVCRIFDRRLADSGASRLQIHRTT